MIRHNKPGELNTLASTIANRFKLANLLGMSFDGKRDLYEALGYNRTIGYDDFLAVFKRQDIAEAIISRPVKATWTGPLKVIESNNPNETVFEKAFEDLEKKLKLKTKFIRLDKLTGLGRYGALLLGFNDITSNESWQLPVNSGKRELLYVKPLGESSAVIATWETDTANERYGLPLTYNVTLKEPSSMGTGSQVSTSSLMVHHTRILHVVEGQLENEVEGTPRLEVVYNRLQDFDKVIGGSAEMFWRGARPPMGGKVDNDYNLSPTAEAETLEQFDELEHGLRRFLILRGITLQETKQQIVSPSDIVDVLIQMVSTTTTIPKRILTGSERGELSSGQDADEWDGYVTNRRTEFVEPEIIRPFVDRMIEVGVLPKPMDDYSVEWQDLYAESEDAKVTIGAKRSAALRDYFANPEASEVIVPKAFCSYFLGLDDDAIEVIMKMREEELRESLQNPEEDEVDENEVPVEIPATNIIPKKLRRIEITKD